MAELDDDQANRLVQGRGDADGFAGRASGPRAPRRRGPTIQRRVFGFCLAVSIPLLALSIGGLWMYHRANQAAADERLVAQAHAMALLLDSRFVEAQQLLQVLSGSRMLAQGDLDGFLQELRVVAEAGDAEAVSLAAPDGRVLLSTKWSSATPPEMVIGTQHALEALASGQWSISNLFVSPTTRQHAVSVVLPFDLAGPGLSGRHLLGFILKRNRVLDALVDQRLPAGSVATILDRNKTVVARTLRDPDTVGLVAGSRLAGLDEDGVVSVTTWEGVPAISAHARAPLSGYWVRIHVPEAVFQAPLRAALLRAVAIGAVLMLTSFALALLFARQLAASLRFLTPGDGIHALHGLQEGQLAGSGLREVDELAAALSRASAQRDSALAERKRAEEAAMASAATLRSIMDTTTDCVKVLDAAGHYLFANVVACRNFGVASVAELQQRSWFDIWEDEQGAVARAAVAKALAGRTARFQGMMRNADGQRGWWDAVILPIPRTAEAEGRVLVVSRDSTADQTAAQAQARATVELEALVAERTRALSDTAAALAAEMRRREEAQAALEQSQKLEALGQLTSSVAHDFNNILAAIQGSFRLIERRVDDPTILNFISHGTHAAGRGAKLIGQLMTFARREEQLPVFTDLAAALREAEDMICHVAGRKVSCSLSIAPDIWPIIVDPIRLETVLLNLAANARDAMPAGGTIAIAARNARAGELPQGSSARRDHVLISITDTGIGMDADTLQRATEPFFTTKPPGQGTGLGLASAHAFVNQSSGVLGLTSAPGQGTTVRLFLPRADVLMSLLGPGEAMTPATVLDPARHGGATLLLVEDDAAVRAVTAGLLRQLGYQVIEAPNAETAEALAYTEGRVDMLLTDVIMSGVPGPQLVERMRAMQPGLPALYLTGQARGPQSDGVPVLFKPFTDAALAQAILKGLGRLAEDERAAEAAAAGIDRLRERLQRPELREAYLRWLALRGGRAGTLPATAAFSFDDLSDEAASNAYLVEVVEGGAKGFHFVHAGRRLEEGLGKPLVGMTVGGAGGEIDGALGGSISAVYRRCVTTGAPSYDYARFTFGDGRLVLLERLVLPLSADGVEVTHVAGAAVFSELNVPEDDESD